MDDDHQDLLRHLFAVATEVIETTHGVAVAGQAGDVTATTSAGTARRLQVLARDLTTLADAALIVAELYRN